MESAQAVSGDAALSPAPPTATTSDASLDSLPVEIVYGLIMSWKSTKVSRNEQDSTLLPH